MQSKSQFHYIWRIREEKVYLCVCVSGPWGRNSIITKSSIYTAGKKKYYKLEVEEIAINSYYLKMWY